MATTVGRKKQAGDKKGKGPRPAGSEDKGLLARAGRVASAKAKQRPAAAKERVDYIGRTKQYVQGVIAELKRVHWPGVREVAVYTLVVVLAVAVLAVLLWVFDEILHYAFHFITGA